jgi:fermentation-respiration switch protein FrsA (DUF1100 family)
VPRRIPSLLFERALPADLAAYSTAACARTIVARALAYTHTRNNRHVITSALTLLIGVYYWLTRLKATSALRAWIIASLLVFIFFMLRHLRDRLVYYPMPYPQGDWGLQAQVGAHDLWFTAQDGIRLNAWWFPEPGSRFVTLFLHGNAGNVTHRIDHAHALKSAGSAVLVLDYRGYGKSTGRPSERGLHLDADASYDAVLQLGYDPSALLIHGESLGTAVAVDLASRRRCAGLILESPLASLGEMAATLVPILGPLLADGFKTKTIIKRVRVPLLVMHGDADEIVPFSQGQAVFAAANQPKDFWRIRGAHHNDLLYIAGDQYVPRLCAFYNSLLTR